jgi:hypothetical protein
VPSRLSGGWIFPFRVSGGFMGYVFDIFPLLLPVADAARGASAAPARWRKRAFPESAP